MEMQGRRKVQALTESCRRSPFFYRTFIVAEDGLVDLIEDDDHDSPTHHYKGLRPGLWRSFVRREENEACDPAAWIVWVWDATSSREMLDQMVGKGEVGDDMKDAIRLHTSSRYIKSLDWKAPEVQSYVSGDSGIAFRSRYLLSPEFFNYLYDDEIGEAEDRSLRGQWDHLPDEWRATLEKWFRCFEASCHGDEDIAGAQIGGAVIGGGDGVCWPESFAKDAEGRIIGVLLGDMFGEDHHEIDDYDVVEHEEALEQVDDIGESISLSCIHGGDPGFETATPNYLPKFQIKLQKEDLQGNTAAIAGNRSVDYLVRHQIDLINPYIDLSQMLEDICPCHHKPFDAKTPLVLFNSASSAIWASLRESETRNASVVFHLPRLAHAVNASLAKGRTSKWDIVSRSRRVETALANGLVEWAAPTDWHHSSRPDVCSSGKYKLEPAFRYVGCGYTITPTSEYPPLKAAHIWRWVAEGVEEDHTIDEVYEDPLGAYYRIGREADRVEEVLGHTAMLIDQDEQRLFADIFGADPDRNLLFGWLRTTSNTLQWADRFCAFLLPGHLDDDENFKESMPPFLRSRITKFGLPQLISSPTGRKPTSVPLVCRHASGSDTPNPIEDFTIQIAATVWKKHDFTSAASTAISTHLVEQQLLHPLVMPNLRKRMTCKKSLVQLSGEDDEQRKAMTAYISRGQAPADFGYVYRYLIHNELHPDCWDASERLPSPALRHQGRQSSQGAAWVAPEDWYEPQRPTLDPTGRYLAIDVMSYVGCGHVLPPWASYPPLKAKFVWSRLPVGDDTPPLDSTLIASPTLTYRLGELMPHQPSKLEDILGQTAIFRVGGSLHILDVVGVDESRRLVFGFSRLEREDNDRFFMLQYAPSDDGGANPTRVRDRTPIPDVDLDSLNIKSFDKFALFLVEDRSSEKPIVETKPTAAKSFLDLARGPM